MVNDNYYLQGSYKDASDNGYLHKTFNVAYSEIIRNGSYFLINI